MRRPVLVAVSTGVSLLTSAVIAVAAVTAGTWNADVKGVGGTAITGHATMKPAAGGSGTEVDIMLMTDSVGAVRPWHVHIGSCARSGGIFGDRSAYTPITIDANQHGMTKATLSVPAPDTGSYYISVHHSAGNMGKIVACGDLVLAR